MNFDFLQEHFHHFVGYLSENHQQTFLDLLFFQHNSGIIIAALLLSFVFSILPGKQPFLWQLLQTIFSVFYQRLNRKDRSVHSRKKRGWLVTIFMILAVFFSLRALLNENIIPTNHIPLVITVLLSFMLSTSFTWKIGIRTMRYLDKKLYQEAYNAITPYTQDDLNTKDPYQMARSTVTVITRHLDRFLIAPVFYYIFFISLPFDPMMQTGLFFVFFCMTISALKFSSSFRNNHSRPYAQIINVLDFALHFIPSRLTAFLIILAAFLTPHTSGSMALKICFNHEKKSNASYPLAAMAGALSITLLGPALQEDISSDQPWIGSKKSSAKVKTSSIRQAVILHLTAVMIAFFTLIAVVMIQA